VKITPEREGGFNRIANRIAKFDGVNLAPDINLAPEGELAQALDNVSVRVSGQLVPLFFVSPGQINAQLPSTVPAGYQKLCGSKSLDYVRFRHADDDLVRAARQQDFLRQAKDQIGLGAIFGDRAGDLRRVLFLGLRDREAADREVAELGARRRLDLEIGGRDARLRGDRRGRGAVQRRVMRGHGSRTLSPIGATRQKAYGFSAVELTLRRAP